MFHFCRNEKLECGICHELIDEDEYCDHVQNCNKSDEENEDQPTSKRCSSCGKQVKDLTQHRKTCSGRDDENNHRHNSSVRSYIQCVHFSSSVFSIFMKLF